MDLRELNCGAVRWKGVDVKVVALGRECECVCSGGVREEDGRTSCESTYIRVCVREVERGS